MGNQLAAPQKLAADVGELPVVVKDTLGMPRAQSWKGSLAPIGHMLQGGGAARSSAAPCGAPCGRAPTAAHPPPLPPRHRQRALHQDPAVCSRQWGAGRRQGALAVASLRQHTWPHCGGHAPPAKVACMCSSGSPGYGTHLKGGGVRGVACPQPAALPRIRVTPAPPGRGGALNLAGGQALSCLAWTSSLAAGHAKPCLTDEHCPAGGAIVVLMPHRPPDEAAGVPQAGGGHTNGALRSEAQGHTVRGVCPKLRDCAPMRQIGGSCK
jgi:hypothetical protein